MSGKISTLRSITLGLAVVLVSGCATFSGPEVGMQAFVPQHDTTPVSIRQMQLLVTGEWYAVRLPEKDGWSSTTRGVFHNGYVGRLQQSDDESLTLTEVTRCTQFDSTSALRNLPVWGDNTRGGETTRTNRERSRYSDPRSCGSNEFRRNEQINFDATRKI